MTYSQPTTRTVNVSGRTGSGPRVARPELPTSTPISPNGAYIDKRNPDRLYDSKIREAEELTGFIKKLVGDQDSGLTRLATEKIQADAKAAVGELVADVDISDVAVRDQDRFRQLSPYAKDLYEKEAARAGSMEYSALYNAKVARMPLLKQDSTNDPELAAQQAIAIKEIEAEALEESGLLAVPPALLLQYQPQIQQTNSAISLGLRTARAKNYTETQKSVAANGLASSLGQFGETIGQYGDTQQRLESLRVLIQSRVDQYKDTYTSQDLAGIVSQGISRALPGVIENKANRSLVLESLKELTTQPIYLRDGTNLWDVPDANGKSLRFVLQENIRLSTALAEDRVRGRLLKQAYADIQARKPIPEILDNFVAAGAGDELMTPESLQWIQQAMSQIKSVASVNQDGAAVELLGRMATEGLTREELIPEVIEGVRNSELSPQFGARFIGDYLQGEEGPGGTKTQREISASLRTAQGQAALNLEAQKLSEALEDRLQGFVDKETILKQARYELIGEYASITDAEVEKDPRYNILENSAANLAIARERLAEKYKTKKTIELSSGMGGTQKSYEILEFWTQKTKQNGGVLKIDAYHPGIVNFAKQIYETQDPTVQQLQETLEAVLANTQYSDGKPMFEGGRDEIKKQLQDVVSNSEDKLGFWDSVGKPVDYLFPVSGPSPKQEAIRIIQDAGLTPEEATASEAGVALVEASLRRMSGATDPEAKILNAENYDALSSGISLEKKLPQIDPKEKARPYSFNFGEDNPMFIAIGINNRTRKPDGSKTKVWKQQAFLSGKHKGKVGKGTFGWPGYESPELAEKSSRGTLAELAVKTDESLKQIGLSSGSVAYNNVLFNALDVYAQAGKEAYAKYLVHIAKTKDYTLDGIAEARAKSWPDPVGGSYISPYTHWSFPSYNTLLKDQRSRAGTMQFRRRF